MTQLVQFQLRRGTAADWTSANPVLSEGEPGLETDTDKFKFGDGVSAWTALPYAATGSGGGGGPYDALGAAAAEQTRAEAAEAANASAIAAINTNIPVSAPPSAPSQNLQSSLVAGAFPTCPIVDTGVRTAENPLSDGGNWVTYPGFDSNPLQLASNNNIVGTGGGGDGAALWSPLTAANVDAYVEVGGLVSDITFFLRVPSTTSANCYRVKFIPASVTIFGWNGTSWTGLITVSVTTSPGDLIGARIIGPTIQAWHKPVGGSWTLVTTVTDTNGSGGGPLIPGAGFTAVHLGGSGDIIGTYAVGAPSTTSGASWVTPSGGSGAPQINNRGQVAYSTTYVPGDSVLIRGQRVVFTSTVTTVSGTSDLGEPFINSNNYQPITAFGAIYAADYGVVGDSATDNWVILQSLMLLVRSLTTNSSNGFRVILPSGTIMLSKTLIIPTQTMLQGQGLYSTALKITNGANCDVVQSEVFNNTAQAALLNTANGLPYSIPAGSLRNAFRWGLQDLTLHGNMANQSPTGYYHGISILTNGLTSATGSDPDFDPAAILRNVQFRSCSGDGFFHNGRSAIRLEKCIAWFCQGNGFSPSFDTQIDHCQAGFCGLAGFYHNHGAVQGSGNKSYNNGDRVWWWTSGQVYAAASYAATPSGLYYTAAGITSSTPPQSDTTNWAPCINAVGGGATSPQAWGIGVYFDSNASEITMNCDCQENSASSWYVRSILGGIHIHGVSSGPNFGGGNQSNSNNNTTNPNNYAHLVLDNAAGVVASLGVRSVNSATFALRLVNGSVRNDIRLAGDTSATFLSGDSTPPLGTTNLVTYNGVNQTVAQAVFGNAVGDGSHGAATLDGTTTNAWSTLTGGNTYTMSRDGFTTTLVVNSGITLVTNGYHLFATQSITFLTGSGIDNDGLAATSSTGAVNTTGGSNWTFGKGGAGGGGGTAAGTAGGPGGVGAGAGTGGTGSGGAGGGGGIAFGPTYGFLKSLAGLLAGVFNASGTATAHGGGAGGGGGGGDGTNRGGGGGAGGNHIFMSAPVISIASGVTITSRGGAGFQPTTGNCGGGAGGGGGSLIARYIISYTNAGTVTLTGGTGAAGVGTGTTGGNGNNGALDPEQII